MALSKPDANILKLLAERRIAAFDDVVIRITPESWLWWDTGEVDANYFGGKLSSSPGYILPLA